jgi:hypothetical protein
MAICWARLRWAIAKTFATPWKPLARPNPGESYRAQSRSGSLLLRGKSFAAPRRRLSIDSASVGEKQAAAEVDLGIERIFSYAAWADKFDGAVHNPPFRNIAIAMNEPIGTVG